jgi:hypothetical protein
MATSGSGREVVYGFQDITTVKRSAVVLSAAAEFYQNLVVFALPEGDRSLWQYNRNLYPWGPVDSHWVQISPGPFQSIAASAGFDLLGTNPRNSYYRPRSVVFGIVQGDRSLWEYDPNFFPWGPIDSHWVQLSPAAFDAIRVTTITGLTTPTVYGIVHSDHSLWEYNAQLGPLGPMNSQWTCIPPGSFETVSAGTHGSVVFAIVSGDHSLWKYSGSWIKISDGSFFTVRGSDSDVGVKAFAIPTGDHSLWEYDLRYYPNSESWTLVSPGPF